jgi:DNA-binding PadR family transcriptional regulator
MTSSYVGSLSPEFALLGLLSQGPAHGYELHQKLHNELGQIWHLSQSQIYNILNRLEAKRYIRGKLQEQEGLPAKRLFRLTPSGKARFETWLGSPSRASVRAIRVEFTTRLYFSNAISVEMTRELIDAQIHETQGGLARLQRMRKDLPPEQIFNHLGLELRIRQLTSILEWLASCHKTLIPAQEGEESG